MLQRSQSFINLDNVKIFTTPRKLLKSLQAPNEASSDFSENKCHRVNSQQSQSFISPLLGKFNNCTLKYDQNGFLCDLSDGFTNDDEQFYDTSESVSSTEDICQELITGTKVNLRFSGLGILCGLIVLFAVSVCLLLVGGSDDGHGLVPT